MQDLPIYSETNIYLKSHDQNANNEYDYNATNICKILKV